MDLAKLIADSLRSSEQKSEETKPNVQPLNDCVCGHPRDAHDGPCEVLECDCEQFVTASAAVKPTQPQPKLKVTIPKEVIEQIVRAEESKESTVNKSQSSQQQVQKSETDVTKISKDKCKHICERCTKWWTHGEKLKCRYPDQMRQGLCPECVMATTTKTPEQINWMIEIRNDERKVCKDMSVQQIQEHIQFMAKKIEELRIRTLESMKVQADLEEEEVNKHPESEREAFRQALRNGTAKKLKEKKEKAESAKMSKAERMIQSLMKIQNKTREEVMRLIDED